LHPAPQRDRNRRRFLHHSPLRRPRHLGPGNPPLQHPYSTDNGSSWVSDNNQWSVLSGRGTRNITLLYSDESDPSVIPSGRDDRITPITTGSSKLLCDDLLTTSEVLVDSFTSEFSSF